MFKHLSVHGMNKNKKLLAVFAVLLLGALCLRLLTFERYLPYEDRVEGVTYFLLGQHIRGVEQPGYLAFDTYPALLHSYINAALLTIIDWLHPQPWFVLGNYLYPLRLVSVVIGFITTLLVMFAAWQLGGLVAGGLAGIVWGYAPIIVERNSLAVPDPYIYIFVALAFATAISGWKEKSPYWLLLSLLAGIAAILTKVWPVTAILPFVVVALGLTYQQPRRMLPWMTVYAVIAISSAGYLIYEVAPLDVGERAGELYNFRNSGIERAFSFSLVSNNFWYAMYPIGKTLFWVGIGGGLLGYLYNWRSGGRTISPYYPALFLLFALLTSMLNASFITVDIGRIRHALPASVALIIIWSAMIAQMSWALGHWLRRHKLSGWKLRWGAALPVFGAFLALAPHYALGNIQAIRNFQRPHVVEVLWRWADVNVPNDGIVLSNERSELERTWNRVWGGYDGDRQRQWWYESAEEIAQHTPQDYIERGIMYFMSTDNDRQGIFANPALDSFIEQLTLVKVIPAGNDKVAGSTAYFYRMAPPQISAGFDYGGQIRLVGYDISSTEASPGDTITFRPYWRVSQRPQSNYSMFVHLYPADELRVLTQYDGAPTDPRRPTLTWDDPNELYIGPDAQIHLPNDLPPGLYRLAVGIYDYITGQRLRDDEGRDFFEIAITVR